jgi:hypothetical protein
MRMQRMLGSLLAILVIAFGPFVAMPRVAEAANPYGAAVVIMNGGGGVEADGSDGIYMNFNTDDGGEKLCWRGQNYYYRNSSSCSAGPGDSMAVILTVLDTADASKTKAFQNMRSGSITGGTAFDTLTISDRTGSAQIGNETATGDPAGDGSVVMTYTADVEGLTYTIKRTVTYLFPNLYYTDQYEIIVPAGNPANKVVKLYKGGDTAPGGNDQAKALLERRPTFPVNNEQSINPSAGVVLGVREISRQTGMSTFEGVNGIDFSVPFSTVYAGGDIGFNVTLGDPTDITDVHDAGFMVQWTIGSTPGTYTEELEQYVGIQAVNLIATWSSPVVSGIGRVNFTLTNAFFAQKSNLGFVFTMPAGLFVGGTVSGCPGTNISVNGSIITVTGISMEAATSCIVSVDVGSPSATSYTIRNSNVTVSGDGLVNSVGRSTVRFTAASPTFTPRPATATRTPLPPTATPTNTASPTNTFTPTPHPFAIKDVAVGASFTLAVLHNGSLVTWGFNRDGQASLPRWMASKPVSEVETGSNYALALGTDGRVYGWGKNDFGQLRIPTTALRDVRTISAGLGHAMAIKKNGDLVIWGRNDFKQTAAPLAARKQISAISAGHSHSLAVKNGQVIAWGRNTWGQTSVPKNLTNVIAVSGGFDHSLALRSNGNVICWGRNNENQCKIPAGLKNVIAISAGVGYSMALTRDGAVVAWGRSNLGQANVPNGIGKAGAISAGYVNSVIGMRDANVVAFGDSALGALVSRTPTVTAVR